MAERGKRGRGGGRGAWDIPPAGPRTDADEVDPAEVGKRLRDFDSVEGEARVAIALIGINSIASLILGAWIFQRVFSGSAFEVDSPTLEQVSAFTGFSFSRRPSPSSCGSRTPTTTCLLSARPIGVTRGDGRSADGCCRWRTS